MSAAMNSEEKLSRLLFSFSNLSGWVLCACMFAPLNSQGGHVNMFAPAGKVKSGSRCGILALMSAVMLDCLWISLAAIKSVVVGDQVNQGCSAVWHNSKELVQICCEVLWSLPAKYARTT